MRIVKNEQMKLGEVDISKIEFDLRSRDEIPQLLMGLQYIWCNHEIKEKVFEELEKVVPEKINKKKAGMEWNYGKFLFLGH